MLTQEQLDRENDRRWALHYRAATWRAAANRMKERAVRMAAEDNSRAALMIAAAYEYLAEFEEKPPRRDL
jgi:hypothetical protein